MAALLIDGRELAERILSSVTRDAEEFAVRVGRKPRLTVVLVGDNPASRVYVAAKAKTALRCGIEAWDVKLPASTALEMLERSLAEYSRKADGVLLQLPLPSGFDEFRALLAISPEADVDGLHPENQGLLLRGAGGLQPCTPRGVVELVDEARRLLGQEEDLSGLHAVVVGRSVLVGRPASLLLLQRNCTVTMTHSRTRNLSDEVRRADIVIAALGKAGFVKGSWLKRGAIAIDVGINRTADGKIVGDIEDAAEHAAAFTPVPGGVGPMTIAMLMQNTVEAARRRSGAFPQRR